MFSSLASLLLLAAAAQASVLTLQSPKVTVSSSTSEQLLSESLTVGKQLPKALNLSATDTLKLTFQVVEEGGKGIQPHQTFLRFYDEKTGEEGIQPVRVTNQGKAKFELKMSKPPSSLPPTTASDPLSVTLIIGSFVHDPVTIPLFSLYLPPSQPGPVHPDEASFQVLPEIEHTFRPDPKMPNAVISAVFSGLVLAPWVVLLGLWAVISPRVPHLTSHNIIPFIAILTAFEGLLVWYWIDLKLGQVLLYGSVLGVAAFFAGKNALSEMADRRCAAKASK